MIKNQDESRPDFWTFGGRAALVVVLLLFGFRAALLNTGLGDIAEFLAGHSNRSSRDCGGILHYPASVAKPFRKYPILR